MGTRAKGSPPVLDRPTGRATTQRRGVVVYGSIVSQTAPMSSLPQAPTGDEAIQFMRRAHDRYDDAIARRCYDEAARHEADYQAAFDVRKSEILRRAAGRGRDETS